MKIIYSFLLVLFFLSGSVYANPFSSGGESDNTLSERGAVYKIIEYQNKLRSILTEETRKLEEEGSSSVIFLILSVCFLYGAVHAIGPGHSKGVVSAYVISGRKKRLYAASIGFFTGLIHGFSSIALILFIYYFSCYRLSKAFDTVSSTLTMLSAAGIVAVGVLMLTLTFRQHDDTKKRGLGLVLFCGLVPCPAIFIVMAFFISSGFPLLGFAAAVCLSLGMALTLGIIAAGASKIGAFLSKGSESVHVFLERLGAFAVIILGILLAVTSYYV